MKAIAPNLSTLVGDLVGARLVRTPPELEDHSVSFRLMHAQISHAGSLMNLAKSPASTIQILGVISPSLHVVESDSF